LKKFQLILIFGLLLSLVIYGIYSRLSEEYNFFYEYDSRYQVYSVEDPPEKIYFAGEEVPLSDKAVAKKFERELQVQTYWNSSKISLIKRARHWLPQIEPILKQHGIPKDFKYLAVVESMLNNVESPKSAAGFWQIMASTGTGIRSGD
jgi:membrane-bound lytic murein transglycosylase D